MHDYTRKVFIVGAGAVGSTYAYTLMKSGLANEIVLTDIDEERTQGEVMDLNHGLCFAPPVNIRAGDYTDCTDANLIVITAGAKQKSGQSRLELVQKNSEITRKICDQIKDNTDETVIVMVTNPVDVLTYVAQDHLDWSPGMVIGSGTVLDSARFKYMLSEHCKIDARNVHAYILGEHGDSELPAWSMCHLAGIPIKEYCPRCEGCDYEQTHSEIFQRVKDSAYHIIDYKGATYYGIGMSLMKITEAILRNENSVLTVSTMLKGQYGLNDICLSVPCVIGRNGVSDVIESRLADNEQKLLEKSAQTLRKMIDELKKPA